MDQTLEDIAQVVAQVQQEEQEVSPVDAPYGDTFVRLHVGLVEPNGASVNTAEVRELNGFDEEAIARTSNRGAALVQILERAVVSLGSSSDVKKSLQWLSLGDRLELLLAIRKVSFGPEIETVGRCESCAQAVLVRVDVDSGIPRRESDKRESVLELPSGAEVVLTWPSGSLHNRLLTEDLNAAELATATIVDCVASLNGLPLLQGADTARSLALRDRQKIMSFLVANNPGPVLDEASGRCGNCGESVSVTIPVGALFPN